MPPELLANFVIIMTVAVSAGIVLIFRGPVGRALARRIEGHAGGAAELAMKVEELESRIAELELERGQVAELQERLDFAERVLVQKDAVPKELPR